MNHKDEPCLVWSSPSQNFQELSSQRTERRNLLLDSFLESLGPSWLKKKKIEKKVLKIHAAKEKTASKIFNM
ncbi:hypothetical protein L6452_11858 [Arctium lappa]|uniref:Uncharacterized protein n=1 Tax=Arctium lappa TaxID=4217 RepID=A0ACB9DPK3_ARCLA|nr:hypothetical protein L6452_11858 [Arctium lappa]